MTNAKGEGRAVEPEPLPDDLVSKYGIGGLGVCFGLVALLVFYSLVATWPVPDPAVKSGFEPFSIFRWKDVTLSADLRLFITVILAGAVGSLIHALTSFVDYVGNRKLARSWIWWLILRTPIGMALALLFYLVLRGGLVVPSLPNSGGGAANTSQLLNPYGIAGISAMAGMFSKQATDKLREIFDTLFRTQQPVKRADPLTLGTPAIVGVDPPKLKLNDTTAVLTVTGRGFQDGCKATIGGAPRQLERVSDTVVKVTLEPKDKAAKGTLELVLENPGPSGGKSEAFSIAVGDP